MRFNSAFKGLKLLKTPRVWYLWKHSPLWSTLRTTFRCTEFHRVTHWSHYIRCWPISYTGVHGGPIGRPRSAERVVILHTLSIPRWRQFLMGLRLECIKMDEKLLLLENPLLKILLLEDERSDWVNPIFDEIEKCGEFHILFPMLSHCTPHSGLCSYTKEINFSVSTIFLF